MARRTAFHIAAAAAALVAGGIVVAQMESGDRGIAPIDSSGTLEITGIHVDVGGKDANAARYAGWRVAQREGFRALWAKQHGRPVSESPNLSDSVLDTLVSSIIVEREQIGPTRYIADLGILFDRARAGEMLGVAGVVRRSAPMLLIPVLVTGATMTSVEQRNVWQRSWAQFRTSQSPIDYVRVSGAGVDPLLINAAQTERPGRGWWRNIIDYYGAADVLVAEASLHREYPGGPAVARFIGRHGPDGEILGGFELQAKDSADIPRMMAEGVARMDQLFTLALANGRLRRDSSLIIAEPPPPVEEVTEPVKVAVAPRIVQLQILTRDEAGLSSAFGAIRGIVGVDAVSPRNTAIGGWSILLVTYRGEPSALASAMSARGWSVSDVGGTLRVNPGLPAPTAPKPPADNSQAPAGQE
ncbi:heavy-metal-associated domain-containing protein [Sphingomonas sp.]|uniref:heavy-metal-associated domain-containing protein n=1 Tax=Sphingomonas sp. TaxID=28214 RepID=UPI00286D6543|nr:heavy-metal-associated domain-containing protein [Sphingomonas sp.]